MIELDPKNAYFWNAGGIARAGQGQWDQAITDYSKAIELDYKNVCMWMNRGNAYARPNQPPVEDQPEKEKETSPRTNFAHLTATPTAP